MDIIVIDRVIWTVYELQWSMER